MNQDGLFFYKREECTYEIRVSVLSRVLKLYVKFPEVRQTWERSWPPATRYKIDMKMER